MDKNDLMKSFDELVKSYKLVISELLAGLKPGVPQSKRNELIDAFKPLVKEDGRNDTSR